MPNEIEVTAVDKITGDKQWCILRPGKPNQYAVFMAEPLYLANADERPDGTVVLTLKKRETSDV